MGIKEADSTQPCAHTAQSPALAGATAYPTRCSSHCCNFRLVNSDTNEKRGDELKLTILGNGAACNGPNQAGSGYLIQHGNTAVLLDCGTGVFARLQEFLEPKNLQMAILSHTHWDHCCDLMPLRYLFCSRAATDPQASRPYLWLPPGGKAQLDTLSVLLQPHDGPMTKDFRSREYTPDTRIKLGDLAISFAPMTHYVVSYAVRVESPSCSLVFSGDTGPNAALPKFATGADLLLCEASCQGYIKDPRTWGHLTAVEAGIAARTAKVKRLLLTHLRHSLDPEVSIKQAQKEFPGPVEWAREKVVYTV